MRISLGLAVAVCVFLAVGCSGGIRTEPVRIGEGLREGESEGGEGVAPGAPGMPSTWSNAQKIGIGTAYEAYDATGQFSDDGPSGAISKVWFSLGKDRITEVMWGLIHEAQVREIRFVIVGPEGVIEPTRNLPLVAPPVIELSAGGLGDEVQLLVTPFTDPGRDTLVVSVGLISPRDDLRVFALVDPALANTGSADRARVINGGVHAFEGEAHLVARTPDMPGGIRSVGFAGSSGEDLDAAYMTTGEVPGNVAFVIELPLARRDGPGRTTTLAIGFGETFEVAEAAAQGTLATGAMDVFEAYRTGWLDYFATLEELPRIVQASQDGGRLAAMSAFNLKVMEDKTHAGALIASLSNPWGDTAPADMPQTGYKAVWPRDFYQVASALLALGDQETALAAYRYLPRLQVTSDLPGYSGATGWFLQKTHVDGELEWVAVQHDQTAMPIMLGYKLWRAGVIDDGQIAQSYGAMLKPAADFLVDGGKVSLLWNTEFEATLGYTQQERWEEQAGYSPSTVAAVIGGLVTAGELALQFGDPADAARYFAAADELEANLEAWMFTTSGAFNAPGTGMDGRYFIRITRNTDPNDKAVLGENNGRPGLPEDQILDGGFLELVRYGVRSANAPSITATLPEYLNRDHDDTLRVFYQFGSGAPLNFGFRRYGNDGYGEDGERGTNYHEAEGGNTPGQRGRVWPFFSGEFAHYALALKQATGEASAPYDEMIAGGAASMEAFANEGLQLPEQVWDGVGPNPFGYGTGEGTNSATPLAWTHAEYIKLLRSIADGQVWDRIDVVAQRYQGSPANQIDSGSVLKQEFEDEIDAR